MQSISNISVNHDKNIDIINSHDNLEGVVCNVGYRNISKMKSGTNDLVNNDAKKQIIGKEKKELGEYQVNDQNQTRSNYISTCPMAQENSEVEAGIFSSGSSICRLSEAASGLIFGTSDGVLDEAEDLTCTFSRFAEEINSIGELPASDSHQKPLTGSDCKALFLKYKKEIDETIKTKSTPYKQISNSLDAYSFYRSSYIPVINKHIAESATAHGVGNLEQICIKHFNSVDQILYRAAIFSSMLDAKSKFVSPDKFMAEIHDSSKKKLYPKAKQLTADEQGNIKSTSGFFKENLVNHVFQALIMAVSCQRPLVWNVLQNGLVGNSITEYGSSFDTRAYRFVKNYDSDSRFNLLRNPSLGYMENWKNKRLADFDTAWNASTSNKFMLLKAVVSNLIQ